MATTTTTSSYLIFSPLSASSRASSRPSKLFFPSSLSPDRRQILTRTRHLPPAFLTAAAASASSSSSSGTRPSLVSPPSPASKEEVFFDGGAHYGDLITNLVFGLSFLWLPLTVAAVFRSLFLRYRFTNLRVTVVSGLAGQDRKDFSYKSVKDVQYVPRFIGLWGDVVITLSDGTKVELKSLPRFREISRYCLEKAGVGSSKGTEATASSSSSTASTGPKGFL